MRCFLKERSSHVTERSGNWTKVRIELRDLLQEKQRKVKNFIQRKYNKMII